MKNTNRDKESLNSFIHEVESPQSENSEIILLSPSDIGVSRNFGKNGARFAPKAVINLLKKQNNHIFKEKTPGIEVIIVSNQDEEKTDFNKAQSKSIQKISKCLNLNSHQSIIHLGGGHDHIYPLLMALDTDNSIENIIIFNIDAHCDTRVDNIHHSGTPFRNYDTNGSKNFHLIQFGIHEFSNSRSTLSKLSRGSEEKYFYENLYELTNQFTQLPKDLLSNIPFEIDQKCAIVLSLDCDGIDGSQMQAVSAVNAQGIPTQFISTIINHLKNQNKGKLFFGIYEYNPVFDNLSLYGCKSIVQFIYQFLK